MNKALPQWDQAAQWYDQHMGKTGDTLNATIIRPLVLEMLGDLEGTSVLDAGCGSGYLAAELAEHAAKVVGTDFAPNFVSLCKQKYKSRSNLEFAVQDIGQPFQYVDAAFDVVVCKMVLQYVPDIQPFATEAMRMLKPGGRLLVVVDHPFRAAYFYAQQRNGSANSSELYSGKPQTKIGLWGKAELTWYARTTSDYIRTFMNSGFELVEMREPLGGRGEPILFSVLALQFVK